MHNKNWQNTEWSKINSKDDIEKILKSINGNIAYINNLIGERKVAIQDTEWILDDFERLELGISKLKVCNLATDDEISKYNNIKNKLNEKLKELNLRIFCQD